MIPARSEDSPPPCARSGFPPPRPPNRSVSARRMAFASIGTSGDLAMTTANGGVVTWSDRQIQVNVPAASSGFLPGPKQLMVKGSNGLQTVNGLTIHVLGTVGAAAR